MRAIDNYRTPDYVPPNWFYEKHLIEIFNDVPIALLPRWLAHTDPTIRNCAKISYDKRVRKES